MDMSRKATFETIADVVDNAVEVHRAAGKLYSRLSRLPLDDRARMLAQYMASHEREVEENLKNHRRSGSVGVLGTYIQYTLEEPPREFVESLAEKYPLPTTEELCEIAQQVDHYLVTLFEEARTEIDPPTVKAYLDDLMFVEELERNRLTQTINSLYDT